MKKGSKGDKNQEEKTKITNNKKKKKKKKRESEKNYNGIASTLSLVVG